MDLVHTLMVSPPPGPEVISTLFQRHGVPGAWAPLEATGIANYIYATEDVVLRLATDHSEGVRDARTESVAAPVVYAAGIRTPRMLAWDDSREIVDGPYSLWERVHAETLGLYLPDARMAQAAWRELGAEIALLHETVTVCPDPNGWLDEPGYGDPRDHLETAARTGLVAAEDCASVGRWLRHLEPFAVAPPRVRFLHGDLHSMNVMCTKEGHLAAVIDWGDAGWGDIAFDFSDTPAHAFEAMLDGYSERAPEAAADGTLRGRILWARLSRLLARVAWGNWEEARMRELLEFAADPPARWRPFCP